jgi:hypothetical protein
LHVTGAPTRLNFSIGSAVERFGCLLITVPRRIVGWLAGFGAGALISAVAFDLIAQDQMRGLGDLEIALWLLIGALVFIGGDRLVESRFGEGGASGPENVSIELSFCDTIGVILDEQIGPFKIPIWKRHSALSMSVYL